MILALTLLATLADTSSAAGAVVPARRYALILGVNRPARADQKPLRYADDDAVRFYEVFRELPGQVALFALLDEETQRQYPEVVAEAELPTKPAFFDRAERMFQQMAADRQRGLRTELYLVYSGHGFVDERGEGHLGLGDDTFSRTELYEQVLARSPADVNHVIVDACDAYFFVQSRGDDPQIEALLQARAREFLDRQTLKRYPNTGAILSTASAAESHEWSEIRGGVFSHQVRSALLGAADADQDGAIAYQELEAFVLAANLGVRHAGAARAVYVRPPERDRRHAVLELAALSRAHRLHIDAQTEGRIAVADDRGRRYLDLHKAGGFELALSLLPGVRYFVRRGDHDYLVPGGEPVVELAALSPAAPLTAARGADIADAYARGLFAVPFGPQLVNGFRLGLDAAQQVNVEVIEEPHPLRTAGWITGGAAVVAGGLAAGFWAAGNGVHGDYQAIDVGDPASAARLPELEAEIAGWDARTNVALGAAIGLGVTAATLLVLDLLEVRP